MNLAKLHNNLNLIMWKLPFYWAIAASKSILNLAYNFLLSEI